MSHAETEKIVRAYHDAYRRGDINAAGAQLAESFKFSSPIMAFDSPQQHLAALVRFVPFITGVDMISELYGEGEATLVYDLHTSLPGGAATSRNAEHFRVADGRISSITIIFDATPWRPIISAAADMRGPLEVAEERST
jgi:ketosteroid isomerase-like protein